MKKLLLLAFLAISPVAFTHADAVPAAAASSSYHKALLDSVKASVINAQGKADVATMRQKKYLFIYFSASWCPPCRKFTPSLVEFYNKKQKDGDFDLLFVSSDRNQEAMTGYMKQDKMPWHGLKLSSDATKAIKKKYAGRGIPCLVLLNENDEVVAHSYVDGKYVGPEAVLQQYEALKNAEAK